MQRALKLPSSILCSSSSNEGIDAPAGAGCETWIFADNMALFLCYPALALFALFGVAIEKLGVIRLEAEKKVRPTPTLTHAR